jgi:hypothetical protein
MARLALITVLLGLITIIACAGNQYFDTTILKSQVNTINQEINQINEKLNQLKVADDIAGRKETKLTGSMKRVELSIYTKLKTARLKQDIDQYTKLIGEYQNYLTANYPPAMASNILEDTINVLTEINNNYIKKYNLTVQLQDRTIELERLNRDITINTPK